jgi:hypothetical protein
MSPKVLEAADRRRTPALVALDEHTPRWLVLEAFWTIEYLAPIEGHYVNLQIGVAGSWNGRTEELGMGGGRKMGSLVS